MTLQPFIDLGFHTVPLGGELRRLEDGTKTIPDFQKDWRAKYTSNFNTKATQLGGAITGEQSNIIAIDCDNTLTWQLFRSLDPHNEHVYLSRGKGYDAGTLIYRFTSDLDTSFSINDGMMALDFYSNGGFVYLPTKANKTKVPLPDPLPPIPECPDAIKLLITQLQQRHIAPPQDTSVHNVLTANCLAPLVRSFANDGKFMPGLFRIITPRAFRELTEYVDTGYIHPSQIPPGRGSEYLSKVSAILGADISIDQELYCKAMSAVNALFTEPMAESRLDKTILEPMLTTANVDGKKIWQYDEDWAKHRTILQSKRQVSLEVSFDDKRNLYSVVDSANRSLRSFTRDSELMAFLEAAAVAVPKKADVKRSLPIANMAAHPNLPFGYNEGDDPTARILNTFVQSEYLAIFNNPDAFIQKYKRPVTILQYLDTLVPDNQMRNYLLSFLHTKLKTFNYSPVVLYFMGTHGSGKDVFVQLLERIIGSMARPTTREFLEMFNGWMVDNYFAQLDEYGNQLTNAREKDEALGKIKAYSGKRQVQVRQMRTDGFHYEHNMTFIMTANRNPLMLEENDRRICFLQTPNILAEQQWVLDKGGIAKVIDTIFAELKDFCYYMATEVTPLSPSEYVMPPESEGKQELIADSMYAAQRLAYALKNNMQSYVLNLAKEHACEDLVAVLSTSGSVITTYELDQLYDELTEHNGDPRAFHKVLRQNGVTLRASTRNNEKVYRIEFISNPFLEDIE